MSTPSGIWSSRSGGTGLSPSRLGGKLEGTDVGDSGVDGKMDLAPLTAALDAMLAGSPLAVA